jgi:hypothetical protein
MVKIKNVRREKTGQERRGKGYRTRLWRKPRNGQATKKGAVG